MAKSGLNIDQTRGNFQCRGKVLGVSKDKFYTEKMTSTNKPWRSVNFGIQYAKDSVIYVTFNGMPQEKVYYSGKDKDGNSDTVSVLWKDRYTYRKEGYRLIGMTIGLEKTTDDKGKTVNDKKYLVSYDAAEYVSKHLEDGASVFVKGTIEYSHFAGRNGELSRSTKFIPNQISLCQEIDFDAVDKDGKPYEVMADFNQHLVYTSIEKGTDDMAGKFVLSAKIVNYNTVEDAEFVVEDLKLATNLRKLDPFTAIKVWGKLQTVRVTDTVEVPADDGWGSADPMKRQVSPYKMVRLITGADPASRDFVNYTEEKIDEAIAQMKKEESKSKAFESASTGGDDWGTTEKKGEEEDDTTPPW